MMPSTFSTHTALRIRGNCPTITAMASSFQHQLRYRPAAIRNCQNLLTRGYTSPSSSPKSHTHTRSPSCAQPASPIVPSTSSTATTSLANDVNPPPSTRPADLNLPEPVSASAGAADKLKRYVALGRAYLSFYKTGLKNVYHNYRASLPLRRSLGLPAYLPISPPPAPSTSSTDSKTTRFRTAVHSQRLSRANFQLVRRAAYDVRRMIPFSLILIVCGEMTPLAVLFLGNAVTPFTCRVPQQIKKARLQRAARKRAALAAHQAQSRGSVTGPAAGSDAELELLAREFTHAGWVEKASAQEILQACAALGLVRTHTRPPALVSWLYRPRLRRYVEYLALDDELIRQGGGVPAMEAAEVSIAVEERGGVGVADGKECWEAEREERRWLQRWLERA
ncbi:uncharacterized protein Aud_002892 [Aspergillus udagawae]|uniref:Letm1 RBD domain-containing protein n=1 Tax=Aspergillus udagawae TaxID=91492 RepID=A0A8E0UWJ7_9EURO|nr:uncharacterized protein Aud_002892 [Aspergillus udagawae]GIC86518.1 hypothetical protein Aud_002892 [Aspergillus udagawae]